MQVLEWVGVSGVPDRVASVYSPIWDPVRKALWSGVVNTGGRYRYCIASGESMGVPVGIKDLRVHIGAVHPDTCELWIASSPVSSENAPEMRWVFSPEPGDHNASGLALPA